MNGMVHSPTFSTSRCGTARCYASRSTYFVPTLSLRMGHETISGTVTIFIVIESLRMNNSWLGYGHPPGDGFAQMGLFALFQQIFRNACAFAPSQVFLEERWGSCKTKAAANKTRMREKQNVSSSVSLLARRHIRTTDSRSLFTQNGDCRLGRSSCDPSPSFMFCV